MKSYTIGLFALLAITSGLSFSNAFAEIAPNNAIILEGSGFAVTEENIRISEIDLAMSTQQQVGGAIKSKDYSVIDIGIAAHSICLQASAEGLGSCMLGWFDEKKVKTLLGIPRGKRAELVITLGYPSKPHREKQRKDITDIVRYNSY